MKSKKKFVVTLANSKGVVTVQSCGKQHCGTKRTSQTKNMDCLS